jgi:hypothetical protein
MTKDQRNELAQEALAMANKYKAIVNVALYDSTEALIADVEANEGQEISDVLEGMSLPEEK